MGKRVIEDVLVDDKGAILYYYADGCAHWDATSERSLNVEDPDLIWLEEINYWRIPQGKKEVVLKWVAKGKLLYPDFKFNIKGDLALGVLDERDAE